MMVNLVIFRPKICLFSIIFFHTRNMQKMVKKITKLTLCNNPDGFGLLKNGMVLR